MKNLILLFWLIALVSCSEQEELYQEKFGSFDEALRDLVDKNIVIENDGHLINFPSSELDELLRVYGRSKLAGEELAHIIWEIGDEVARTKQTSQKVNSYSNYAYARTQFGRISSNTKTDAPARAGSTQNIYGSSEYFSRSLFGTTWICGDGYSGYTMSAFAGSDGAKEICGGNLL